MTYEVRAGQPPAAGEELLARLEAFLEAYRPAFRRQDRFRRALAYLMGLLCCPARKNVENLARAVSLPPAWAIAHLPQALQHFVDQSPWDDEEIVRLYLGRCPDRTTSAEGLLVLSELTFVKQGRFSVGVQRQYSTALARKVNCQLALSLAHVQADSFVPLGMRLYLPRGWAQNQVRLSGAGVPESALASKAQLALHLLQQARQAGWQASGVAVIRAPLNGDFQEGLKSLGLPLLPSIAPDLLPAYLAGERRLLEDLGLSHFEGRSWRGFHHHACLVLLAHAFLREHPSLSLPGRYPDRGSAT